ncbi:MAG: TolC family protein [Nitrospirae bacterium]|nr:TolC family protein [Nitrospirota bacterium]
MKLGDLIQEALESNHIVLMAESKLTTTGFRIPQVTTLPDPIIMLGYQNAGWNRFTLGQMDGTQVMFSVSQQFPYPGKLSLREESLSREYDSLSETLKSARLKTVQTVKELFYDLFFAYKDIGLIGEKTSLFSRIEDAALSRYSSGMGSQADVLMAQTEKYMLLEKVEMEKQQINRLEGMLNSTLGREATSQLSRPSSSVKETPFATPMEDLLKMAYAASPEVRAKELMIEAAKVKVKLAKKDYYPDFNITAAVAKRAGPFEDMWSLTAAVNVPIYYKNKQRMAVLEADSMVGEADHDLESVKFEIASGLRDSFSMVKTSEKLMSLYKTALIAKTYQDFNLSLSGYVTGKADALTVITRLKALLDYETLYWKQFAEREKAIARIEALTGIEYGISKAGEDK